MTVETEDESSVLVIAHGQDAIFIEFGTGVYHNGLGSPHPKGEELGMTIGSYGKHLGLRRTWSFERDG